MARSEPVIRSAGARAFAAFVAGRAIATPLMPYARTAGQAAELASSQAPLGEIIAVIAANGRVRRYTHGALGLITVRR